MESSSPIVDEKDSFDDTQSLLDHEEPRIKTQRRNRLSFISIIFNCVALVLNIAFALYNALHWHPQTGSEVKLGSFELTRDAIKLEARPLDDIFGEHESIYRGEPRDELDVAWKHLIRGYNTRVPVSSWLPEPSGNHSLVELEDGSGDHMATPAVLHELHCLRTIREYLFPEHYPGTWEAFKPEAPGKMSVHIDHCIDMLRQSSMCHADMALVAYEWWEESPYPQNVIHTPHLCANWETLSNWAIDHSFSPYSDIIRHPLTGKVPWPSDKDSHH